VPYAALAGRNRTLRECEPMPRRKKRRSGNNLGIEIIDERAFRRFAFVRITPASAPYSALSASAFVSFQMTWQPLPNATVS